MTRPTLFVLLVLFLAPVARAQSSAGDLGPAILERLAPLRERHGVPALGGAVVQGGRTTGIAAVGSRRAGSPEGVTIDDRWHLGSCSKAMTATLLARLVEAKQLEGSTTLGETFATLAPEMDPAWRGVTLEQLLCHRAGAPADLQADGLWSTLFLDHERTTTALRRLIVETVTAHPPAFPPGEGFLYSNGGVTIAAAMGEAVTRRPWEELIVEQLFTPLGITSAGFGPPTGDAPRGHRGAGDARVALEPETFGSDNPPAIGPAGTIHLSLADWATFAALHLRGARGEKGLLLRPATFEWLHRPRGEERYALGWGVADVDWAGGRVLTHSGSNTLWFCTILIAPEADVAVVVTANAADEETQAAVSEAVRALVALARS